jgi:putative heme-binding domain-containing protein
MLRPDHPALTPALLERLLGSADEGTRIEAARTLARGRHARRFALLAEIASTPSASVAVRADAIAGLAEDAEHQRDRLLSLATDGPAVLRREALRSLKGASLSPENLARLREANRDDPAALEVIDRKNAAAVATETGGHKAEPPTVDDWLARLAGPADPSAGERAFFHAKGPGCYRCHQVDGRGGQAGPDLTTLASATDRRRLVESIVAPSREIAPQFVAWSVARTDGTLFTGILLEQSPDGALVFADSEGRRIVARPDEIADRKPQKTSIMPDDLPRLMTLQEMRDIIAFLGRRNPPAQKPSP